MTERARQGRHDSAIGGAWRQGWGGFRGLEQGGPRRVLERGGSRGTRVEGGLAVWDGEGLGGTRTGRRQTYDLLRLGGLGLGGGLGVWDGEGLGVD